MLKFPAPFPNVVFVCTHKRPDGAPKPCCADRGGAELRDELKQMVRERGLTDRSASSVAAVSAGANRGLRPSATRTARSCWASSPRTWRIS